MGGEDGWGERLFSLSQPHLREKEKRILVSFVYVPTNPGRADVSFEDNFAKSCNLGAKAMQNGYCKHGQPKFA